MKKIQFLCLTLLIVSTAFGKDKIILKDGQSVKGEIVLLEQDKVIIQKGKSNHEFTSEQVAFIEFDIQNVKISKILSDNMDEFNYLDGKNDAQLYHKRFGGNFALGVLFGVFGFIGVAVGNVQDPPAAIPDYTDKMKSSDYREGYRKTGKGKNLGAAGAGWAVGFILLLIISAAAS
jgi:hypothetical protein